MTLQAAPRAHTWAVLSALLWLAGCPDSNDDPGSGEDAGAAASSGSAGGGGGSGKSCGLVSAGEASATLGVPDLEAPEQTVNSIVTVCRYAAGNNAQKVTVRYQAPTSSSEFMYGKQSFAENFETPADVSGVGEMAYAASAMSFDTEINTLVFLSGETEVEIVAPAPLDKIETLARAIIDRL